MISICLLRIVFCSKDNFSSLYFNVDFVMECLLKFSLRSLYSNNAIGNIYCYTCWNSNRKFTNF